MFTLHSTPLATTYEGLSFVGGRAFGANGSVGMGAAFGPALSCGKAPKAGPVTRDRRFNLEGGHS